jgi:hypothetical protein
VALVASLPLPRGAVAPASRLPVLMLHLSRVPAAMQAAELLAPLPLMAPLLAAPPPMVASEWVQQPSVLVAARAVRRSVQWAVALTVLVPSMVVMAWLAVPKRPVVGSHRGTSKPGQRPTIGRLLQPLTCSSSSQHDPSGPHELITTRDQGGVTIPPCGDQKHGAARRPDGLRVGIVAAQKGQGAQVAIPRGYRL